MRLPVAEIIADPQHQPRGDENPKTVNRIRTELERGGDIREPVLVQQQRGGVFYLRDGFHRYRAAQWAGLEIIAAVVTTDDEAAISLEVARLNTGHGERWRRKDLLQHLVHGVRDGALVDSYGVPLSFKHLGRAWCGTLGNSEDGARQAISRAVHAAAETDPGVAVGLARILAAHKPDAPTTSDKRPTIDDLLEAQRAARRRESETLAKALAVKLRKMPKADRGHILRALEKIPR